MNREKITLKESTQTGNSFVRGANLKTSMMYMGSIMSFLVRAQDTDGRFAMVEYRARPGNEPPPHVHTLEGELFYVLEGEFDVYVGEEALKAKTGECIILPKFKPYAFVIRSPRLRGLILYTPGGVEGAFRRMSSPAQNLEPPTEAVTYSMSDLEQTARRFGEYGVQILAPDEVAEQLPLYPKPLPRS